MRGKRWLVAILLWMVGTLACSGRAPQAPVGSTAEREADPAPPLVEGGNDQLPPMGMAEVLVETDALIEQRG